MTIQERRSLVVRRDTISEEITIKGNEDPLARKIHGETWPLRRAEFKRHANPRLKLPEISMANWLTLVNAGDNPKKFLVFIDGHYLHTTVISKLKLFMDFNKFRDNLKGALLPIQYYSMGSMEQSNILVKNFLMRLSTMEGIELNLKPFRSLVNGNGNDKENLELNSIIQRYPALRNRWGTFAPEMSVQMSFLLNEYPEEVNHVLLFTRDIDMLAAIRNARAYDVRITLARCNDVPISSELLSEADHVLDIKDVVTELNCSAVRHS